MSFAFKTLGSEDGAHVVEGTIEITVHHDIIIFGPMTHLVAGLGHAGADHLLVILGAGVQTPRKFTARRRQDENADQIGGRVFAQLLSALPIEERPLAAAQAALDDLRAGRVVGRVVLVT